MWKMNEDMSIIWFTKAGTKRKKIPCMFSSTCIYKSKRAITWNFNFYFLVVITKLKLSHYKLKKIKDIICIIDTGLLDVSFIPIKLSRFMKSITSLTEIQETQIFVESLFNLILFLCQIVFYIPCVFVCACDSNKKEFLSFW